MAARRPPALADDLIIDILLRLPPDDTACLTRASLVCKAWRRLLSDGAFLRRYRDIHGAAPVLGFLYNDDASTGGASGGRPPLFLRTTQPSPFPAPATSVSSPSPSHCRTLDCRHGRVLLFHPGKPSRLYAPCFTVWDPITGKERCFSAPVNRNVNFMAAVLCATKGCNHIGCSGGPFLVVLVAQAGRQEISQGPEAVARLYSSETGKWRESDSDMVDFQYFTRTATPNLFAGETLYFLPVMASGSRQILKFRLWGDLSVISVPAIHGVEDMILRTAENCGLGLAAVAGSRLRLLSRRTDPDGFTRWVQDRAIEMDSVIPIGVSGDSTKFHVVGFAEGTGYILISANDSIFSVEVKSCRISKIGSGTLVGRIFPFMRFYNPDLASTRLQAPPMWIE